MGGVLGRCAVLQLCGGPISVLLLSLTPNDPYSGRTAPLTSKRCILYIYSTNIGTEYLNMVYTLRFFSLKCSLFHNYNLFGSCIIHILYTGCAKIKKKSGAKRLITLRCVVCSSGLGCEIPLPKLRVLVCSLSFRFCALGGCESLWVSALTVVLTCAASLCAAG